MKILLVDDQPSIISSLVSCIPWHELGITGVSTAGSAREARMILEKQPIDILLTDIEMPGEDGLDLLSWVRDQNMDLECILLTAHADFYYAKRAISLRVCDYVIQPARDEDVIRAVRKAILNRQTNAQKNALVRYHGEDFEVKNKVASDIFSEWPSHMDIQLEPDLLQDRFLKLDALGLPSTIHSSCILILGHIRNWHRIPQSPSMFLTNYRRTIDAVFPEADPGHISWFVKDNCFHTVIFTGENKTDLAAMEEVYREMDSRIGCRIQFFCCTCDLNHLKEAFDLLADEQSQVSHSDPLSLPPVFYLELDESLYNLAPNKERNLQELERIKTYIREKMAEPITRTQIAEDLYLSPSYVSHIIKDLEDLSCKELVTQIKMEYARKLLRSSHYAIGDIAVRCGYDSFAYFSKVYKATYGITPSSERENR